MKKSIIKTVVLAALMALPMFAKAQTLGLSVLPARWKREEHKNTQGFRVVRAAGA